VERGRREKVLDRNEGGTLLSQIFSLTIVNAPSLFEFRLSTGNDFRKNPSSTSDDLECYHFPRRAVEQ